MNILMLLTNGFDPDIRVHKEAYSLVKMGYEVDIWCWDRERKHRNEPESNLNGYRIRRFFISSKYGNGLRQLIPMIRFYIEIIKNAVNKKINIVHCHDFDTLILGCILKMILGMRLVFDEHDSFDTYFINRGSGGYIIAKIIRVIQDILLRCVDTHIIVTPGQIPKNKKLSQKYGPFIIMNTPEASVFTNIEKIKKEKTTIAYIGNLSNYCQEIDLLCKCGSYYFNNIEIHIYGSGSCLQYLINKYKSFSNIIFHGYFDYSSINKIYRNTDIAYIVYPTFISSTALPNKFFESVLSCTPMIVNKNSYFGKIALENGWAFSISENSLEIDLKNIIELVITSPEMLTDMMNSMKEKRNNYDWKNNEILLSKIYDSLKV